MKPTWFVIAGLFGLALILPSCGSGSAGPAAPTNNPPVAAATATSTPAGTATPPPTPTPPFEDDNPGPVATVSTRLFVVASEAPNRGGEVRQGPFYDPDSNTDVVRVGEFIIFDTTPKNAAGEKCQTRSLPVWTFENRTLFEHVVGSQPFQYRVYARRRGIVQVSTVIDGVQSNPVLNVEVR
jgi:hypothetical protein